MPLRRQSPPMADELVRALRDVRETLLANAVSPRVEEPADINRHYCRWVAETVAERVGDAHGLEVVTDGGRGFVHTWITYDGRHYDAECVEGVEDHRDLPFFRRHPEAAVHVERETADAASLRTRGGAPLYPAAWSPEPTAGPGWSVSAADRRLAVAAVLLGLGILAVGLAGEWAIQHHLLTPLAGLRTLFVDLEIVGELVALVVPVVLLVLRPALRADAE